MWIADKVGDVVARACEKIVDAQDVVTLLDQRNRRGASPEIRATRHQDALAMSAHIENPFCFIGIENNRQPLST